MQLNRSAPGSRKSGEINFKILFFILIGILIIAGIIFYIINYDCGEGCGVVGPVDNMTSCEIDSDCQLKRNVYYNEECVAGCFNSRVETNPKCNVEFSLAEGQCKCVDNVCNLETTENECTNECGDGGCDYVMCKKLPCPCLETRESCPQDCGGTIPMGVVDPNTIIPKPQQVELNQGIVVVDSSWRILADLSNPEELFNAEYLRNKTFSKTGVYLNIFNISSTIGSKAIIIGNPNMNTVIRNAALEENIDINSEIGTKGYNQGYVLKTSQDQILIVANSTTGTFYGVISTLWLLSDTGGNIPLPNTKIVDWPDLKLRSFSGGYDSMGGVIYELYPYDSPIVSRRAWIENLSYYKYNLWMQSLPSFEPQSLYDDMYYNNTGITPAYTAEEALPMVSFLKNRHFFTTVTLVFHPGTYNPNVMEGYYANGSILRCNSTVCAAIPIVPFFSNMDLEIDSNGDGLPDGWNAAPGGCGTYSQDSARKHSGQYSLKYTTGSCGKNSGNSGDMLFSNDFTINSNDTFLLSFWVYRESGGFPVFKAHIANPNSNDTVIMLPIAVDNDWQQFMIYIPKGNMGKEVYFTITPGGGNFAIDDFRLMDIDSQLINVLHTNATSLRVFSANGSIEYQEGVDYQLNSSGQLFICENFENFNSNCTFPGTNTTITIIQGSRIGPDSSVKVYYDYYLPIFGCHPKFGVSYGDPETYNTYEREFVQPTLSLFQPDFVNVALDEFQAYNRDSRSAALNFENYQFVAMAINNTYNLIKKHSPSTKIVIFGDALHPYGHGGDPSYNNQYYLTSKSGATYQAVDLVPKQDAIYIPYGLSPQNYMDVYSYFNNHSLKIFGYTASAYGNSDINNIMQTSYGAYANNLEGIYFDMYYVFDVGGYLSAANYGWNAVKNLSEIRANSGKPSSGKPSSSDGSCGDGNCDGPAGEKTSCPTDCRG